MGQYYSKINTIFKRDLNPESDTYKCILPEETLAIPEFEVLRKCRWECTEKIDGTNISIHIIPEQTEQGRTYRLEIHGKTETADIPKHLLSKLKSIFTEETVRPIIPENEFKDPIILFGEGYGAKIQKGGNYIKNDVDFILFDVQVGSWWLKREACEEIAQKLGIKIVPLLGYFTIDEAIDLVKTGFISTISENRQYEAEGVVIKAPLGMLTRSHQRIIGKIKTCDFRQLERKNECNKRAVSRDA